MGMTKPQYIIVPTSNSPAGFDRVVLVQLDMEDNTTPRQRIGPFYSADEAHAYARELGWVPKEVS